MSRHMNRFLLLLFVIAVFSFHSVDADISTVVCEGTCSEDLRISCNSLISEYTLHGSCCSLTNIPINDGCRVQVGNGTCSWLPKNCGNCPGRDEEQWQDIMCGVEYKSNTDDCPASFDGYPTNWTINPLPDISCAPVAAPTSPSDSEGSFFLRLDVIISAVVLLIAFTCGMILAVRLKSRHRNNLLVTRATMAERRRRRRENEEAEAAAEEERKTARHDLFMAGFHFQEVLPDRSNITAEILRNEGEEHPHEQDDKTKDGDAPNVAATTRPSGRLSNARKKTAVKDECCICLEDYEPGETICVSITGECDHVFHKECILEWMKKTDHCPMCRLELL